MNYEVYCLFLSYFFVYMISIYICESVIFLHKLTYYTNNICNVGMDVRQANQSLISTLYPP
jgi:hypothetical protein